jgi:hypothetical protein
MQVGGSSAMDPQGFWNISGVNSFAIGIDNSQSDRFVICSGATLGTTDRIRIDLTGVATMIAQPCFLSFLPSNVLNVTGASATYTLGAGTALTNVFSQASAITTGGTFTASVTGRYDLRVNFRVIGTTIANLFNAALVTSNRTYISTFARAPSNLNQSWYCDAICDMDAADTATFQLAVTGEAGETDDINGSSTLVSFVSGTLVA